jgi:hypothetical protein
MYCQDGPCEPEVLGLLDALLEASIRYAKIKHRVTKEGARILGQAQEKLGVSSQRMASLLGISMEVLRAAKAGRKSPSMTVMIRLWGLLEEQDKRLRLIEPADLIDDCARLQCSCASTNGFHGPGRKHKTLPTPGELGIHKPAEVKVPAPIL